MGHFVKQVAHVLFVRRRGYEGNMELRLFRNFVAVAEELNFTRAAERLHTAQPWLSQQIRQLEGMVVTTLFYRYKHQLRLTQAGQVLLEEARHIVQDSERALVLARSASRRISIGLLAWLTGHLFYRIGPVLLREHGDVQIDMRTLSSPDQIVALQKREVNLGFLYGPIADDALASEVVLRAKLVAVLPANHPLAQRSSIPVSLLADVPAIQYSRSSAPTVHDTMNTVTAQANVKFRVVFEADNLMVGLNAVAAGFGFCLTAKYLEHVLPKNVVARPLEAASIPALEILMAYRKDDMSPLLPTLMSLFRQVGPMDIDSPPWQSS